ncbi:hypothetical protein EDF83_3145 [Pseudomonas protegens]|uniref:DUF4253 domain-containing protein n=1 Tax=Pseudomonas protegens (strain DSM 19095 / LMG 27888 / CFBP 6595 / CHA0) TaxID=1124983 RepID=A0A2C9ELW6_PSEPH|nr:hypothetical protein [Pseudomonas protegens]MCS4259410.1 hypothetical protein [Pseudomonas sp. BIGb0176]AGL84635.1 hypothetical protein PFLCHA0_c28650 [Pseudomonas protegens CHA0]ROQ56568.1 hypothetical protein EDF83_3145 [Pseudomonas protegens]ROQ85332.1 hypothetical protein EC837_2232 [Pseudomonas protegens]VAV69147.1 hypothetical protein PPRCHA0_2845 [Pseudomonas protegens CHA0]
MDIQFRGNAMPGNPAAGTCDEYSLSAISSLDELIDAYRKIAGDHPGFQPLLSLDDLPQARYTSGHARNNLGLDDASEQEIALLPAECFEQGEYLGYPTTKAEFAICLRNFTDLVAGSSFEDACAHGLTLDAPALREWVDYQQNPVSLLDQPLSALLVPVEQSYQALAAFPNGYFSCDLGPAQNFAVARHFAQAHGYELIGVGASYLGFLRAEPADLCVASAVASDFCALYNTPEEDRQAVVSTVVEAVHGRTHLWLRYVE